MNSLPLSIAQAGIFFQQQFNTGDPRFNLAQLTKISGSLDIELLGKALQRTLSEVEPAQMRLVSRDREMRQVSERREEFALRVIDVSGEAKPSETVDAYVATAMATAMDLNQWPLVDIVLFKTGPAHFSLFQRAHHIVADGFSFLLYTQRLAAVYSALAEGREPAPCQWGSFASLLEGEAAYRASPDFDEDRQFWLDELAACPESPAFASGGPRPADDHEAVSTAEEHLPADFVARLRETATQHGATLAQLFMAVMAVYVARVTAQPEALLGLPVTARVGREARNVPGMMSNVLPLRIAVDGGSTLSDLLQLVAGQSRRVLRHQRYRIEDMRRDTGRVNPGQKMFGPLINIAPDFRRAFAFAGCSVDLHRSFFGTPDDLAVIVHDAGEGSGIDVVVDGNRSLYSAADVQQHAERFTRLLQAMVASPDTALDQFDLLLPAERELLLQTWNDTAAPYPDDQCAHQLFEAQVERTPDAVAVVFGQQSLSYAQLNARANQLAHELIALGVVPDTRVAICVERSLAMIVGLLAILKAGGGYVPLDAAYPAERLAHILDDADPRIVLADGAGHAALGETLNARAVLDPNRVFARPECNPRIDTLTANHLAYAIYTSGSTGTPKGIAMPHAPLVNLVDWHVAAISSQAGERTLQFSPISFDVSFQELFSTWHAGGTLVLIDDETRHDCARMIELIVEQRVHHLFVPYQMLKALADVRLPNGAAPALLNVVTAGEQLAITESIRTWFGQMPACKLHNHYGPSETHVVVAHTLARPESSWDVLPPIGRPIANTRLYLLDAHGQPVPMGAVGELYVGGVGVARGYLNRAELTAERFLDDPFAGVPGARMYRTGDLARYLPDGNVVFLGRNDDQVKIRGFRIECGEIEAQLVSHPAVHEAVVLAYGDADKRLVAYVTGSTVTGDAVEPAELRAYLAGRLPDYMVPAAFVRMDTFPLTPSGKLDRRALPAPDAAALAHAPYEAPVGPIETALAQIWCELLGLDQVSRHDSFFALGGHSLLAVRVISRIADMGAELPLATLFATPTLSALASEIQSRLDAGVFARPPVVPVARDGVLPLSFAQQRLWFLDQFGEAGHAYHIPLALRLHGPLDVTAWQRALDSLWARHEALRSVFVSIDDQPQVRLLDAAGGLPLHFSDLQNFEHESLATLCADEARAPFDLATGPLIRARLIRLAHDEHVFLLTQHHIVSDGWSLGVLARELGVLYSAFVAGQPDPLAPLTIQYPDYAAWQRQWLSGERLQQQAAYWKANLAGAPVRLELPTDRPRPPRQSFDGAAVPIELDAELTTALQRVSQQHGVTLFMTVLAAWAAVLSRLSGQSDVVIGTPSANRGQRETEPLIGFFINTLALRVDLADDPDVAELLGRVKTTALQAQAHQDLPFEQVVEIVKPPRQPDHAPIFQAMFSWQNNERVVPALPGLDLQVINSAYASAKFDLDLELAETDGCISGALRYATALFDRSTIERQVRYLKALLGAMIGDAGQRVASIDLLPAAERELLLNTWNETATPYPDDQCIHQLFEQQAERTPDAVAVVSGHESLTYAELNARANRLAHELIARGVVPDTSVAICVKRSLAMIVGLLAVLKAGGAYVPLDPAYPGERLAHILSDADPQIVLADVAGQTTLGDALDSRSVLDPNHTFDRADGNPRVPGLTSRHLAYVIYTSGSTGMPKGVMVEHRGVVNYLHWASRIYAPSGSVVSSSLSFDATVTSLFTPLMRGGQICLLPEKGEIAGLSASIGTRDGLIKITPTLLDALAQGMDADQLASATNLFVVGGENLSQGTVDRWRAAAPGVRIVNEYGPTETVVGCAVYEVVDGSQGASVPIGRPIANTRLYLLDAQGQPVPLGAVGELYIGGAGVARGYLNRAGLTAERFLDDPFAGVPGARMYRTGDLARYLPDGNLVFLGRNDHQVKIRGFRIECGEIEAKLAEHPAVREAVVLAYGDADKRLVAYVTGDTVGTVEPAELRAYLASRLPDYMVPAAFVQLDTFPLTPNGKLDRRALPAPDADALAHAPYEAPVGSTETALAAIWCDLLGLDQVSRHDSFFALGGHSLLAVRMIERLRRLGLALAVRDLFQTPVLVELARTLGQHREIVVPANLIVPGCDALTPDLLPLIELNQQDIDRIVATVPGGVASIQDIYALSPLQDGILFHHLLDSEGDTYLQSAQLAFAGRATLDPYLVALQQVVNRHDILRTAFVWEGLSTPAQVVCRHASLSVTELTLDLKDGTIAEQLAQRFDPRHYRLDLTQAPLLRLAIAQDSDGRWILQILYHHLISDHSTLEILHEEVQAIVSGHGDTLPAPVPFRNLIAQARLGRSEQEHEHFFTGMLAEVSEPTLPFGLAQVQQDGARIDEAHRMLPASLNQRLRIQAQRLGVSLASLCHVAWGRVLAGASGQQQVVTGTVLFGRMQGGDGADRALGLFINTLPIRLDMDDTPVIESVQNTHARLAGLLDHEHASLALAQRCSGVAAGTPLFSALLNYRHNAMPVDATDTGIELLGAHERTNYPFTLSVEDHGQALGLTAQVLSPIEPQRVCDYMAQALLSLAYALECTPDLPVRQIDILPPAERDMLLVDWNDTAVAFAESQCVHHLFENQAERRPDAVAVVFGEQSLSYAQLNARANRLAHELIALGVTPDTRVAICVERSLATVTGLLAILKAGGAYVPLDPAYPGERLAHILNDAAPQIVLADANGQTALGESLSARTVLDPNRVFDRSDSNPRVSALTSRHLAYVIYTSGSTGMPKGVMVEHGSLTNLHHALDTAIFADVGANARISLNASIAFDASLQAISGLAAGRTLVVVPDHVRADGGALRQFIDSTGLDVFDCTPMQLEMLLSDGLALQRQSSLTVLIGGDRIADETWTRLAGMPHLIAYNVYGPTECTVDATAARISREYGESVIGRPLANTRLYLLDAQGQPVPLGAVGELYIGGAGVARGYLNRAGLTAERFLDDPFAGVPGARMYRTGDLARYLPDGNLVFLGRNDHQVKIRGFRIECGEIEAKLAEHPAVREAVVLAYGDADKRLVAYVTGDTVGTVEPAELRAYLASRLPDYMVPAAFVQLDTFPLTPNGKLDRRALPAPDADALAHAPYEAPVGSTETALAAIWCDLLGLDQVSRHDSFFALGGHSLLAVRMIERLRRLGLSLAVRDLFQTPVLAELARTLGQHREIVVPANLIVPGCDALTPDLLPLIELNQQDIDRIVATVPGGVASIQDIYALSPLQDGMLFHHLLTTEGDPYLLVSQMAFAERDTLDQYLSAIQQVVNRHDILRTAFVWEGLSTPAQVVCRHAPLSIAQPDLDPRAGTVADQLAQRFDPRHYRLDLTQAPLLRFAIAQERDGRWILQIVWHHLIGDHSTLEILHEEVQAIVSGHGDTLPAPVPFRNLIAQARLGRSEQEHEHFFTGMLAEVSEPTLPFGLAQVQQDGARIDEAHRMLPASLNQRLRIQAQRLGVSLASLCHVAWGRVLAGASGQQQVVTGTVLFGRMQGGDGADRALGLFINTLPIRLDMDDTPVIESVQNTHARLAGLLDHEHASLALAQRCSGVAAGTPLFSALLNYRHNATRPDTSEAGIEVLGGRERTNYPFTLSVEDHGYALGLTAQVLSPIEPQRVCDYMEQALLSLADALEQTPDLPVQQLIMLPSTERELLLRTWNQTSAPYAEHPCIHHFFEVQAERTPDAIAVVFGEQSLTYAELNARANRLAHELIALGVKPDTRVAICVERSLAMVTGLLAILKAGGAYVPLDPAYTGERLAHILSDADPQIVLADATGQTTLGDALDSRSVLDPNHTLDRADSNPRVSGLASRHLAYVIYTSGSTGTPKGVMVEHAQVVRLFETTQEAYRFDEHDVWCLFHSFAFDFSVWELWGALRHGGRLVLVPHPVARIPQAFSELIRDQGVTVLNQTPSSFRVLMTYLRTSSHRLRYVIFGGEALEPATLRDWYATHDDRAPQLVNMYGITETTVHVTYCALKASDADVTHSIIGRPLGDLRLYLLDERGQPVPLGAVGELYIGGDGVARGYLNRAELTVERFLDDPFCGVSGARMYRTGDLARYLPDGNLVFLGRNDHQVKIRGFRIECGEIEAQLASHPAVREAVVLAYGDADKRLVAYVTGATGTRDSAEAVEPAELRAYLAGRLPDYMVPAAFVQLDTFPLTPNGKLDRRALPAPDADALAHAPYEAPVGSTETALAAIWCDLLGLDQVSRHDSFFALGGHSLLAVRMIERLRRLGLSLAVRDLFQTPVLVELARTLGQHCEIVVPANLIVPGCNALTPDLLPLIELNQQDIDRIVATVPGGVASIQDIYALSPLQDGMLFHHLLTTEGDPYLLVSQMAFAERDTLDQYLSAIQQVVNRHDILRTAFVWEGLSTPAQVVCRHAPLSIAQPDLDPRAGTVADQLAQRFDPRHYRLDLTQAPLLRFAIAQERDGRWILQIVWHHLIGDHSTLEILHEEVQAIVSGHGDTLPAPVPFRNLIAQARLGRSEQEHEHFFTGMLAEVSEPTLPFGLAQVQQDGARIDEAHRMLPASLNQRLRIQAQRLGVSLASLCHVAWGRVLAGASGQQQVVTGTVLFGRMQGGDGADRALGLFINTLPIRLDMDDTPVIESVQNTHARLAGLLDHEHASLALAQRCSGVAAGTPLFSALLNYRHNAMPVDATDTGIELLGGRERTNYPFTLSVEDHSHALGLTAQVLSPIEPQRVCDYMEQALLSLADALEQTPALPVQQLVMLPSTERDMLLDTWNDTVTPYPDDQCIHQFFELQAARTPDAVAVIFGDQSLTYAELDARASRLAHELIVRNVQPGDYVATLLERSIELVTAQLAILKAGAAYVPLDSFAPAERLAWIIEDCAARLLIADAASTAFAVPVLDLQGFDFANGTLPGSALPGASRDIAYVMYTSGSTGTPKGVLVPHRAVVRLVVNNGYADVGPADRVAFAANPAFDASTFEVWAALLNGATLVVFDRDTVLLAQRFRSMLEATRVNILWLTVGLFNQFADGLADVFAQLDTLIVGGDALDTRHINAVLSGTPPKRLLNGYGPTESTTFATTYRIDGVVDGQSSIPIGRPIANTRLYLLDERGQPVPLGAVGELYIGGDGVARGYLNRAELTVERFLDDPFCGVSGARMYRTGDLARYLPDGNLVFLGRNDHQVKIRGFRIECGEIEAQLASHPAVREAVVLAYGDADKRLVAYVTGATGTRDSAEAVEPAELRAYLAGRLPDYMVPAAFVQLDTFPLTPNGKLDRRALPAPDADALAHAPYEAPVGSTETALAAIWCDLLGLDQVSRHDSFFALGGHSLLAVRMIERLRRLGLSLAVRDLFQTPVLAELARTLGQHREIVVPANLIVPGCDALTPDLLPLIELNQQDIDRIVATVPGGVASIQDIYALSPLQDGMLFHHLLTTEGDPYLLVSQMAFAERDTLDQYLSAIQQVVNRHDILRTAFVWEGLSTPAQVVCRHAPLSIAQPDLDPRAGTVADQLAQRFDPRHYRLDLTQAPLLRFAIAQERDGRWILQIVWHHLIGDHSTLEILHEEVQAIVSGHGDTLPAPVPFRNLIAQARLGRSEQEHEHFFTGMLAEVSEPTLPFGLAQVQQDGARIDEAHRMLPASLNQRLRIQAQRLGVSLASLCHVAWGRVLAGASGQQQVVTGTVLFGRMQGGDGADRALGLFINTLPIRLDMDDTPVIESVQNTHARLAGLLDHEHASLALAQRCSGVAAGTPLFSALLNYRHNAMPVDATDTGIELLGAHERTNYPFTLSVEDHGQALGLTAQVLSPIEPQRVCDYMEQALLSLADALEQTPALPVQQLVMLPSTERDMLLDTWNDTAAPYTGHQCIHQLFEAQAANTPDAVAVVFGQQSLSYAQLNARANQLAHELIALGVVPDTRVAICVERSLAMIVGLLAILKAGGAYVPLDPAYPGERLAHIISDADPRIVLADVNGQTALGESLNARTVLDPHRVFGRADGNPRVSGLTSRHLAYVIYTSGSTGLPKGVMVEHSQFANLIAWHVSAIDLSAGNRCAATAATAFDASAWETWAALCNGCTLVLSPESVSGDSAAMLRWLQLQSIDSTFLVTPLAELALSNGHIGSGLRYLLIGGDRLRQMPSSLPRDLVLVNNYGPTETTVVATSGRLLPGDLPSCIGKPIANTRLYLLDAHGQPVPMGAIGELYIGGAGVARGYLNRPELTAERFLDDPFAGVPGARMYRTGDLARYLPDGNVVFLGRNDDQVKIRGFRIECGEIEAQLVSHPAVREAVVLAYGDADKRLVAYVTGSTVTGDAVEPAELRAYLGSRLPDYMVPAAFVQLDAFPLTPNGKLDRRALPAPDAAALAHAPYEAPVGPIETALAQIWCELLGLDQVSRHDSFFALGGHSLLAVRVISRIADMGAELPLATLFATPTLSALASEIQSRLDAGVFARPPVVPVARDGVLPLSFAQQRLWFLDQFGEAGHAYHIPLALRLHGPLDVTAWQRALDSLWARHEALRSVFVSIDDQPQVRLLDAAGGLPLHFSDLQNFEHESLATLCADEARAPFDLATGPLIRARLIRLAHDEHVFLLTQHHIVSDGWSLGVLARELGVLYSAFVAGQPDPLAPLTIQYPDYAAWQRQWLSGERLQQQAAYWKANLAGAPVRLELPTDRPRPPRQSFDGAAVPIELDAELTTALQRVSQQHGVTLFMTVLAAWAAVLSRLSGQSDVVIGTPSANRGQRETEPLIGFFINTLALRVDLADDPDVAELLGRVKTTALQAQAHQDLPFEQVVEIVKPPRQPDHAPIFQVMFSWQNNERVVPALPGLDLQVINSAYASAKFDLDLELAETDGCISGALRYATALFDRGTIERQVQYLKTLLAAIATEADQTVEEPVSCNQ